MKSIVQESRLGDQGDHRDGYLIQSILDGSRAVASEMKSMATFNNSNLHGVQNMHLIWRFEDPSCVKPSYVDANVSLRSPSLSIMSVPICRTRHRRLTSAATTDDQCLQTSVCGPLPLWQNGCSYLSHPSPQTYVCSYNP
jgi:hypothetical protein